MATVSTRRGTRRHVRFRPCGVLLQTRVIKANPCQTSEPYVKKSKAPSGPTPLRRGYPWTATRSASATHNWRKSAEGQEGKSSAGLNEEKRKSPLKSCAQSGAPGPYGPPLYTAEKPFIQRDDSNIVELLLVYEKCRLLVPTVTFQKHDFLYLPSCDANAFT